MGKVVVSAAKVQMLQNHRTRAVRQTFWLRFWSKTLKPFASDLGADNIDAMGGDVSVAGPDRQACAAFLHSRNAGSADQMHVERELVADIVRELEIVDLAETIFEEEVAAQAVVDLARRRDCGLVAAPVAQAPPPCDVGIVAVAPSC